MSLFFLKEDRPAVLTRGGPSTEFLHQRECAACPLDKLLCRTPKMPASGIRHPDLYGLGEAPGGEEDRIGRPFVGESGKLIRSMIPDSLNDRMRWNNVVRTRPPKNRTPTWVEIECCRPSVERDIAAARPRAVLAIGGTALMWLTGLQKIGDQRGRRIAKAVNGHAFWVYPIVHPAAILRTREEYRQREAKKIMQRDLQRVFGDLADGLEPPVVHTPDMIDRGVERYDWSSVDHLPTVRAALRGFSSGSEPVAVDIETTSAETADERKRRPYGEGAAILSAAVSDGRRTVAFTLDHPGARAPRAAHEMFREFLCDKVPKIAHNAAFELEWCGFFYGADVLFKSVWHDSMCQAFVLDERAGGLSLDHAVLTWFGFHLKAATGVDRMRLASYEPRVVLRYNGLDAKYEALVYRKQERRLRSLGLLSTYNEKSKLASALAASQLRGVPVDFERNAKLNSDLVKREREALTKLRMETPVREYERRYGAFNVASNEHVGRLLDLAGVDTGTRTATGRMGTRKDVLEELDDPLARRVVAWREMAKLRTTYILGLREDGKYIWPDRLMHTWYNHLLTRTGRLSSEEPNLQNFPKRKHKEIRGQVVPRRADHVLLALDYGQIEARVFAMASKDKRLTEAFWTGYDIHMDWAKRIGKACPTWATDRGTVKLDAARWEALREAAKGKWVFASFFGAMLESLASYLGISEAVLEPLFNQFWEEFRGVRDWQQHMRGFYRRYGYVETLCGFRRHEPLSNPMVINTPIQGTAAEIVENAMYRINALAWERGDEDLTVELNVHDDLTFDVPEDRLDYYLRTVVRLALDVPYDFVNVPLTVEASVGRRWSDLKPVRRYATNDRDRNDRAAYQVPAGFL